MKDNWQQIGDVARRVVNGLAPVTYIVPLHGELAVKLERYAADEGYNAETIIAEAVRSYIGASW